VFVLEIKRLSEYEIKVILNEKDMRIMNISFEDFEKNNKRSKDFLSELMFILKETGLIKISEGNIEVDVALTSEEIDERLLLRIAKKYRKGWMYMLDITQFIHLIVREQ
jgi:negative regulator of genetic competence, sporulation and motility